LLGHHQNLLTYEGEGGGCQMLPEAQCACATATACSHVTWSHDSPHPALLQRKQKREGEEERGLRTRGCAVVTWGIRSSVSLWFPLEGGRHRQVSDPLLTHGRDRKLSVLLRFIMYTKQLFISPPPIWNQSQKITVNITCDIFTHLKQTFCNRQHRQWTVEKKWRQTLGRPLHISSAILNCQLLPYRRQWRIPGGGAQEGLSPPSRFSDTPLNRTDPVKSEGVMRGSGCRRGFWLWRRSDCW